MDYKLFNGKTKTIVEHRCRHIFSPCCLKYVSCLYIINWKSQQTGRVRGAISSFNSPSKGCSFLHLEQAQAITFSRKVIISNLKLQLDENFRISNSVLVFCSEFQSVQYWAGEPKKKHFGNAILNFHEQKITLTFLDSLHLTCKTPVLIRKMPSLISKASMKSVKHDVK